MFSSLGHSVSGRALGAALCIDDGRVTEVRESAGGEQHGGG